MSPDKQRIAIAEACGWMNQGKAKGVPALNHRWANPTKNIGVGDNLLPDYLNDLNAMHEAEKVLTDIQRNLYVNALDLLIESEEQPSRDFEWCCATAIQRAEAFLRTVCKWEASS